MRQGRGRDEAGVVEQYGVGRTVVMVQGYEMSYSRAPKKKRNISFY